MKNFPIPAVLVSLSVICVMEGVFLYSDGMLFYFKEFSALMYVKVFLFVTYLARNMESDYYCRRVSLSDWRTVKVYPFSMPLLFISLARIAFRAAATTTVLLQVGFVIVAYLSVFPSIREEDDRILTEPSRIVRVVVLYRSYLLILCMVDIMYIVLAH